ncbi:hypothetical protein M5K25_013047 [Dendrobium thyrsiflorum]|uniref:Uncharacterized protein n=1 Tax=Dendrobium thyrsiflorum TaxID=117978 RepID=A0ABD0V6A3_DENTH
MDLKDFWMAQSLIHLDKLVIINPHYTTWMLVDKNLAADIILYTLIPSSYQAFKIAIRTKLQPLHLDDFYSLLSSEEMNLANEASRELHKTQNFELALSFTTSPSRGRSRLPFGHTNRGHHKRVSSPHWSLDLGATSHLANDSSHRTSPQSYLGSHQITIANGQPLPVDHTDLGHLPIIHRKLSLSPLLHVLNISHNLIFYINLIRIILSQSHSLPLVIKLRT